MASMEKRRRLLFIALSLSLLAMSSSAPMKNDSRPQTRRKSLVSSAKNSDEIGNPEDLAWQAEFLVDQGGVNLLRKITPKSIFIAPSLQALPACAEGYQPDSMNRCVKNVNINHEAHIDFLVQRLNAMYANFGGSKSEAVASSGSAPTGPLQLDLLNIPVIVESEEQEEGDDVAPPSTSLFSSGGGEDTRKEEEKPPIVVDDKDEPDEGEFDRKTFFHEPQTTKDGRESDESNSGKYDGIGSSLVDFLDDTNSSYSEIIDYKADPDDQVHNHTISEEESKLDDVKGDDSRDKTPRNDSSLASTVVLLLTPTKLPVSNGDLIVAHNSSTGMLSVRRDKENGTETEEIITVNLPERLATASTPILILFNGSVSDTLDFQSSTTEEAQTEEIEMELPEEDEDSEDVEESTEGDDEILTHSEAGMMVTMQPHLQASSTPADDHKDTTASKISSTITINNDFVRETILLGVNLRKDSNTTNTSEPEDQTSSTSLTDEKIVTVTPEMSSYQETTPFPENTSLYTEPPENEETTENNTDDGQESTTPREVTKHPELPATMRVTTTDQRESSPMVGIEEYFDENITDKPSENSESTSLRPEDSDSAELMTASSTNNAEAIFPQHSSSNTRYSSSIKQNREPLGSDSKYATSIASENTEHIYTEIKTIDDQLELQKVPERGNFFPDQRKGDSDSQPKDFIRFPTPDRIQNRPSYIRFPSQKANSIHTPDDFKDRRHHRPFNQQTSIENPPSLQKHIYWPSWRNDHQSITRTKSGTNDKPKDRSPIWFWTRMPLVRDPSLLHYPTNQDTLDRSDSRSRGPRRINYYKEISSHDAPRAFARSAIGD
ncbi:dentin sialophosphoprotein-like [Diachasmimorpha longicaudata]|uniref:dentin sialophosphoprotein-like n=1 Tax=Diachasmimorpha longicaudata TaxID=58733 RepID=UPI0030B87CB3